MSLYDGKTCPECGSGQYYPDYGYDPLEFYCLTCGWRSDTLNKIHGFEKAIIHREECIKNLNKVVDSIIKLIRSEISYAEGFRERLEDWWAQQNAGSEAIK